MWHRIALYYITKSGFDHDEDLNLNSPAVMKKLFYDHLKYPRPPKAKKKKKFPADKHALNYWGTERHSKIAKSLLWYRHYIALNKFLDPDMPGSITTHTDMKTMRLHPNFNQHRTPIHRLSSSNPNSQNFPRKGGAVRECIISGKGMKLFIVDYSQIELRGFAHYSRDPMFLKAYIGDNLVDIHEQTRANIIANIFPELIPAEQRTKAKNTNFGIWYGTSPYGLSRELNITEVQGEAILYDAFDYYSVNKEWVEKVKRFVIKNGYVKNIYGGYRRFAGVNWSSVDRGVRDFLLREAVHFVISSTAACILKDRMNLMHDEYRKNKHIKMALQIHDELIFEVPESFDPSKLVEIMEAPDGKFTIPLIVDHKMVDIWSKT